MTRRPAGGSASSRGADLHLHTTHSDGVCSPGEVVRAAKAVGLSALAITDHDTLSALPVAQPEADRLGIELVRGIELTAERDGREIHLLGYFLRPDADALRDRCSALKAAREDRVREMAERLEGLGLTIDLDFIRRAFPKAAFGRRHLAEYLVRTGQVATHRLVFARYLGDDGPGFVPKARLSWREGIALIRASGGVAGLAHPRHDLREADVRELVAGGLEALEVDGPGVTSRLVRRRQAWAETLGLVAVAGSDFHAPGRPGRWVGAITTAEPDLERLRQRSARKSPLPPPARAE